MPPSNQSTPKTANLNKKPVQFCVVEKPEMRYYILTPQERMSCARLFAHKRDSWVARCCSPKDNNTTWSWHWCFETVRCTLFAAKPQRYTCEISYYLEDVILVSLARRMKTRINLSLSCSFLSCSFVQPLILSLCQLKDPVILTQAATDGAVLIGHADPFVKSTTGQPSAGTQ